MKKNLIVGLAVIAMAIQVTAQPRVLSWVMTQDNQTNSVDIADFEYAKVLTAVDTATGQTCVMDLVKGNGAAHIAPPNAQYYNAFLYPNAGLTVAGPATISVRTTGSGRDSAHPVLVTLEICPSAYPVTNSAVLGPGQGAEINLESSTNLIQWTPATNGVYTAEAVMFFRLHLRRIQ